MPNTTRVEQNLNRPLDSIIHRLNTHFAVQINENPDEWAEFHARLETHFDRLFSLLNHLYQGQDDFFHHIENLLVSVTRAWFDRPEALKDLDRTRESDPNWFQSHKMVGGVCYVDLFAGSLSGIRDKIPYFKELGLTYLHLMPLFRAPESENDGGYAISSYREVDPRLGTIEELTDLASALRNDGISLALDFVFNHTSDEHDWALKAIAGDPVTQGYYRIFPDREMPDAYEKDLREIFPDEHPGAFTYNEDLKKWIWTTFHSYQWDLNYGNPEVFIRMAEEMLFLANVGVEVLRLDAVAFTWKKMGTNCENLPETHMLIQAYNAIARIAAPALLFKSEAIVHPAEVVKYIDPFECQISYNPLVMALTWNTLATREINLLNQALKNRFTINPQCAWVNYVRCHDDIGWTFSDEDAGWLGINGHDHRRFLNNFYTGGFEGSFARGLPFQSNPKTGDVRISGTCASLAGLEKAINEETSREVDLAVARILLIHGVILTIGGIPLIYLNDEIGVLNDFSFLEDPSKEGDSRWVHRPVTNWDQMDLRSDLDTIEGRIFQNLKSMVDLRISNPVFSGGFLQVFPTGSDHILGYIRANNTQRVLVLANFSEKGGAIPMDLLSQNNPGESFINLLTGDEVKSTGLKLAPYEFACLKSEVQADD